MKNKILFILLLFIFSPLTVKAEELVYNVCKSGCEYNDLQEVFVLLNDPNYRTSVPENAIYDVVVEIKDGETYNVDFRVIDSGYITNTNAKTFTIRGSDPDNRPTIYSGDDQMSFWIKYGEYFLIENVVMKNVETDYSFHGGDLFIMANGNNDLIEVRNSEFHVQDCFNIWAYSITIKDSAFYADDGIGFDSYAGINTLDSVTVRPTEYFTFTGEGICNAKNVDVEVNSADNGMYIDAYCKNTLDNIKIRGGKTGLKIYGVKSNYLEGFTSTILIKNSDLSQNDISLYVNGNNTGNEKDVIVENTKVKNVVSKGDKNIDQTALGPIVYIKKDCEWSSPIKRSITEEDDATVKELVDGRVIIEESKKIELNIDKSNEISLKSLFNNIDGVDFTSINWRVSDPSVLEIVNNKIIPKKTGETTISGEYADNIYEVDVIVVKDNSIIPIINPSTGNHLLSVALLLLLGFIYYVFISRKEKSY